MITHRGFSAWISSEGQSLRSYEPTLDSRENKVSCWIPSSEGKVREHDTSRRDLCKQSNRTSLSIGGITEVELTRQLIYTSMGLSSRDTSYTVQAMPREAGCDQAQYMSDHSRSRRLDEVRISIDIHFDYCIPSSRLAQHIGCSLLIGHWFHNLEDKEGQTPGTSPT